MNRTVLTGRRTLISRCMCRKEKNLKDVEEERRDVQDDKDEAKKEGSEKETKCKAKSYEQCSSHKEFDDEQQTGQRSERTKK